MIKVSGVIGAIVAAVVGAVVWALLAKYSGFEIGYVAWGIGAAIGYLSNRLGSKGAANGVLCAALALVSIGAGKILGSMWTVQQDFEELYVEEWLSTSSFQEVMGDAADFSRVKKPDEYPQFMVDHGYSAASDPKEVTAEEISYFEQVHVADLKWISETGPDHETWKTRSEPAAIAAAKEDVAALTLNDHIGYVKDGFNVIDILFAVFGVASAFVLGRGQAETPMKQVGYAPQREPGPPGGEPPPPGEFEGPPEPPEPKPPA
ncbi:MAG: hypothetical protein M3R13_10485 [Armatimonadota bacterium]|nr:hypothetical protein [Armatimonadota bacterium]